MTSKLRALCDLRICVDCYYWVHYGWEQGANYPEGWDGPSEPCVLNAVALEDLCDCEQEEPKSCGGHFSRYSCDGCDSALAGDRWPVRLYGTELLG